jgi:sec-independent protein translocase protein TatB
MNVLTFPVAFIFDSTSPGELFLIFGAVLLLFGPKRLPEMARMIGRAMAQLRRASFEFRDQVMRLDEEPLDKPHPPAETPQNSDAPSASSRPQDSNQPADQEGKKNSNDLAG